MKSVIEQAKKLMVTRKFGSAIKLLQSHEENYEESFEYYCTLGIACLYIGDPGSANFYFERARRIRVNDTTLLICQAAIFLRRGDTERAVDYYLEVLDLEPSNKIAKSALEYIRTHSSEDEICKAVDSGKIEKFYPPLGLNPKMIFFVALICVVGISIGIFVPNVFFSKQNIKMTRADLTELMLTSDEQKNPQELDISKNLISYILTDSEIKKSHQKAAEFFQARNDNAAQVEINRLLNSNASSAIKQKANRLMNYLEQPTFDSLKENFNVAQIKDEPNLYLDCYVDWSGRIANEIKNEESGSEEFTLLIGYEDQKNVEGTILVKLNFIPNPVLDGTKPVRILGKVSLESGKIYLTGKSVYQNIKN